MFRKIFLKLGKYIATSVLALLILSNATPVYADQILFQNDSFGQVYSNSLIIDDLNNAPAGSNIILQFGQSLAKTLLYNQTLNHFEFNGNVDLTNNQLTTAMIENVAALPGGASGPPINSPNQTSAKGRIVQLTATDSTAPGCTSGPSCSAGTYTWDGSTWHALQGTVTASTATKIVTVGPTGRDYTSIAAAATYCNTLSGCEMWIDPGPYPVTTSVDLTNTKLYGADGGGISHIDISGAGQLQVKDTFFYEININVGAITASGNNGLNVLYNAASSSSVLFSKVIVSTTSGKFVLGSTGQSTAPTTIVNFINCAEAASDPGSFINTKAAAGLNSSTSLFNVVNQLTKDPLKISDWPVTIVGGSNVVTSGTITSVPDRTILVSQDMDINNAIQSLITSGGGGVIELLVGTHNITAPILLNSNNIEIVGEGPGTIVSATSGWTGGTGGTVAAIQVGAADGSAPVSDVVVRDFTLQVQPDIHGIKVNGGTENKVMDMTVTSTGLKAAANSHTAIVFTDASAPAAGQRLTATRNIINRSDATACNGTSTGFCWVDGLHFDGDDGYGGQSFGYNGAAGGITDSIISENIVNQTQQSSYVFTGVSASGIFSNRSRNIGISNGSLGLALNNSSDDSVINNSVETNNNTSTNGIVLSSNVQTTTIIGNAIDYGSASLFNIGITVQAGAAASNNNIITDNEIKGSTTGINIAAGNTGNVISSNQYITTTTNKTDAGTNTLFETSHHEATANPTVSNDITQGYSVGTVWVNTSNNNVYVCTNSSAGAAVWQSVSAPATGGLTGTSSTTYTINNGNTNTNTTLTFGGTSPQSLTWNPTTVNFNLSSSLSVSGDLALSSTNVAVVNGGNNNLAIGNFSNIRLTGPTAAFTITGIAAGTSGEMITLFNTTSQSWTISNLSGSSTGANQILTGTGQDLVIDGNNTVSLRYDSTLNNWVVTSYNGIIPITNGGTGDQSLTAYAPIFGGTTATGALQSGTVGTAGQVLTSNGAGALPTFQAAGSSSSPFGDGSAGNLTITTGTTTLAHDTMYNNLTLNGGTLVTNGYRVFVAGTLTVNAGNIINNNGIAGGAGATTASAGGAGGTGLASTPEFSGSSAGGAGATATSGSGANNGAAGAAPTDQLTGSLAPYTFLSGCGGGGGGNHATTAVAGSPGTNCIAGALGGAGGAGTGAGNHTNSGGGGGGGGGVVLIYANTINNAGTIEALGGTGGNGTTSGGASSGNGGGGGGGSVIIFYRNTAGSGIGTLSAAGGAAGTGGNGGSTGATGTTTSTQI